MSRIWCCLLSFIALGGCAAGVDSEDTNESAHVEARADALNQIRCPQTFVKSNFSDFTFLGGSNIFVNTIGSTLVNTGDRDCFATKIRWILHSEYDANDIFAQGEVNIQVEAFAESSWYTQLGWSSATHPGEFDHFPMVRIVLDGRTDEYGYVYKLH